MNKLVSGLIGGMAGAICTTVAHEVIRHYYKGSPRLDKLGEEALNKTAEAISGKEIPEEHLYEASIVSDVFSNAMYYSAAASCPFPVVAATTLGLMAGAGAVGLPDSLGLDGSTTAATDSRKLITIGLYTMGGIVSGLVIRALQRNDR